MHVVMHDLHGHDVGHAAAFVGAGNHADHEHPITASASPQAPARAVATQYIVEASLPQPQQWSGTATDSRNVIAHGAIHSADDDVGLHTLFSTFLI